jgi:fumarylacetoacetate (FAA) hydrolase
MTVGLGPAKGKDFATSLGPWLVTADEVPLADGCVDLEATASVNGEVLTQSWAGAQYFPWPDLVARAACNTRLRPGDVLGSGTLNRGCLLELGPLEGDRFLQAGDTVALEAGPLGRLENRIV